MRFKPRGCRELRDFRYVVITETDEGYYHKGQIVICDVTDGIPIEVGSYTKPGKLDCVSERFELLDQAIERSYEVCESGWNHKGKLKRKRHYYWKGNKRKRG